MPELQVGWKYVLTFSEGEHVVGITQWKNILVVATNKRVYVQHEDKLGVTGNCFPLAFAIPPEDWSAPDPRGMVSE